MSIRTIIVGLLAAVCGICATAGVMMIIQGKGPIATKQTAVRPVLVANVDLAMGQEIASNQLSTISWHSDDLPPNALTNPEQALGKYTVADINKGDIISTNKIAAEPTTLVVADGLRAFAIEVKSESTNVGANLVAGNRVDIIWQTSGKLDTDVDPVSVRLIQNVRILAVGQVKSSIDDAQKSITLEVKPKMDEDLAYAQSYGSLSLSLRNPGDHAGIEPVENVNFSKLLARNKEASEQKKREELAEKLRLERQRLEPPEWQTKIKELLAKIGSLENKLTASSDSKKNQRQAFDRIGKGMRAITIQTPTESSGVAGLLEPGDRVDLHFTLAADKYPKQVGRTTEKTIPSELLIENIEVLAVDTKLYSVDPDGEKKMSDSVTLIVMEEMRQDIAIAEKMGTLSLTLRGRHDRVESDPTTKMSMEVFADKYLQPPAEPDEIVVSDLVKKVVTYRGQAVSEIPYAVGTVTSDGLKKPNPKQ